MPWYVNPLFAQAAAREPASIPWYINLLVALATIVVSFFLGGYLGKKFRMPDHGWKIGLVLFSLLASAAVLLMGPPLKLGVDLRGGVLLTYEVDPTQKRPDQTVDMDKLIEAVKRRVNPGGQKEVTIRKCGAEQIEIIVPEVEEAEVRRIEKVISQQGKLEFRILANKRDNKDLIERALADPSKSQLFDSSGKQRLAWWVPVKEGEEKSFNYPEIAQRTRKRGKGEVTEILVVKDTYNVTGDYLTRAAPGSDLQGRPCVNFNFNNAGGRLFGELTASHLPDTTAGVDFTYKLGIILDGQLYSAPSIKSTITDRGEISGSFTQQEVQDLVDVLNAGSLPAALSKEPISKLYSGPTLGRDTIEKSTRAMIVACILVPLFMLWYYRFCGIVANIALVLNMMILFAIMLTVKAAFTLTGFAGLALTVGMAVDNNVLVYERLREELERGATLRMAIRNAFHRASTTIIDANMTTLIAATVLYIIGTDQVKGFAIPLWIGVAISMYTSVFVARVIFDVAEKRQWITRVKMLRVIGHTNINFMRIFPYCATMSIMIIVMAMVVSVYRGQGLFDIDFTGGVSVQALFNEPQDTAEVRSLLTDRLPDLAVSDVRLAGQSAGLQFVINTSQRNLKKVEHELSQVFGEKLARNSLQFTPVEAIPSAPQDASSSKERPDPMAGGCRSQLTVARNVNYQTVEQWLATALEAMGLLPESTIFELFNPKYVEGNRTAYPQWDLKIMLTSEQAKTLLATMQKQIADNPIFPASNTIGGAVAGNTRLLAIYALVASWGCMIIYLWVRFQGVAFGLAAVAALIHDVFIILGAVAVSIYVAPFLGFLMIEPLKINLTIVAAFLTVIGYSVNDTIVVFDRIREVRGKDPNLTLKMVNNSINQTLARTLLTSFTVLLVVVVLYVFGGEAIHGFAFALIVGVLTGTYSSIYVASPILLWLMGKREKIAA